MTRWIGRWIIAVSVLHTLFGLVVFWPAIVRIAQAGVWNSVGEDPMRAAVAWFILSGFFMMVLGFAVDAVEQAGRNVALRRAGVIMLLVTISGIILMPASGFWLMLPPAVAMIRRKGP